uniref:Dymeclin n=1 Tax=Globodera pallida TaxID=36090 RepID=A0A183BPY4_GLOPA
MQEEATNWRRHTETIVKELGDRHQSDVTGLHKLLMELCIRASPAPQAQPAIVVTKQPTEEEDRSQKVEVVKSVSKADEPVGFKPPAIVSKPITVLEPKSTAAALPIARTAATTTTIVSAAPVPVTFSFKNASANIVPENGPTVVAPAATVGGSLFGGVSRSGTNIYAKMVSKEIEIKPAAPPVATSTPITAVSTAPSPVTFSFKHPSAVIAPENEPSTVAPVPPTIGGGSLFGGASRSGVNTFANLAAKAAESGGGFLGGGTVTGKPVQFGQSAFGSAGAKEFKLFQQPPSQQAYNSNYHPFGQTVDESHKAADDVSDKEDANEEFVPDVHFEPVVPLPPEVEVSTGEEGEEVLYSARCKLYRFDKDVHENKERGLGDIKLLYNPRSARYRCVMRREQVFKLCANFPIYPDLKIHPREQMPTVYTWACKDFSDDPSEGTDVTLSARFKDKSIGIFSMGCVLSTENVAEVAENELLKKLAGKEPMNSNDPQWNKMLSFNFLIDQRSRRAQNELLLHVKPLLEELLHNSRETANFSTLIQVVGRRCSELEASVKCENKIFIWQASNALLLVRYIAIFLAQRLSPGEFAHFFASDNGQCGIKRNGTTDSESSLAHELERVATRNEDVGDSNESEPEQFLSHLVQIVTQLPVNALTVQLHAEAIRVLISMLSTQLYEESVTEHSEFLKLLMTQLRAQSGDLVRVLLENFLYHSNEELDDANMGGGVSGGRRQSRSDSFVVSLWSTLQKTLAFGSETVDDSDGWEQLPAQSLSALSLALLLALVYHPSFGGRTNAYKQMLSIFQNAQEVSSLANLEASFKLDFTHLYNRLCATLHGERMPLLLLYLLLQNNIGFRNFVLSRINLEQLVLPVIRVLYDGMCSASGSGLQRSSSTSSSPRRHSHSIHSSTMVHTHQTYLALIVLLMLSEDDFFKKVIHEMTVKNIDWYNSDRTTPLAETTLGGLIVLVFSKTIQINTVRVRDRYFHMNSLATLANLASCFKQLSSLASQKLIGLLETMTKRRAKLIRLLRERAEREPQQRKGTEGREADNEDAPGESGGGELADQGESKPLAEPLQHDTEGDDLHRDITALEEGIRTVLEIVNACLCHNLRNNPNLIYTILYKRAIFEHFHQHPMFQDLVWNIYTVINHFTGKVEALAKGLTGSSQGQEAPGGVSNASVSDILDAIKKGAIEWPSDRLKKFPDLRFKYIEDEDTVDFFVPYIWRLINDGLCLMFDTDAIRLFNVDGEQ